MFWNPPKWTQTESARPPKNIMDSQIAQTEYHHSRVSHNARHITPQTWNACTHKSSTFTRLPFGHSILRQIPGCTRSMCAFLYELWQRTHNATFMRTWVLAKVPHIHQSSGEGAFCRWFFGHGKISKWSRNRVLKLQGWTESITATRSEQPTACRMDQVGSESPLALRRGWDWCLRCWTGCSSRISCTCAVLQRLVCQHSCIPRS